MDQIDLPSDIYCPTCGQGHGGLAAVELRAKLLHSPSNEEADLPISRATYLLKYIENGATHGIGRISWETIKMALRKCSAEAEVVRWQNAAIDAQEEIKSLRKTLDIASVRGVFDMNAPFTSKQDVDAALYFVLWKVHGSPKGGRHALCDDIFRAAEILETEVLRARGETRLLREALQSVVDTSLPVSDRARVFIRGALKNAATLESPVETAARKEIHAHIHSWDGDQCHYCHIPRSAVETKDE